MMVVRAKSHRSPARCSQTLRLPSSAHRLHYLSACLWQASRDHDLIDEQYRDTTPVFLCVDKRAVGGVVWSEWAMNSDDEVLSRILRQDWSFQHPYAWNLDETVPR